MSPSTEPLGPRVRGRGNERRILRQSASPERRMASLGAHPWFVAMARLVPVLVANSQVRLRMLCWGGSPAPRGRAAPQRAGTMSPTHATKCVVCEEPCYCCNDTGALSCGGHDGNGGCNSLPHIDFCSLACAKELQRRLVESIANYHDVIRAPEGGA